MRAAITYWLAVVLCIVLAAALVVAAARLMTPLDVAR